MAAERNLTQTRSGEGLERAPVEDTNTLSSRNGVLAGRVHHRLDAGRTGWVMEIELKESKQSDGIHRNLSADA